LGYDAIRLLVQAMRRASDLTPTAIRDQIAATDNYSGATLILGYDKNRHTAKSAAINRIVDGEVQFYKLIQP
jgi:branched-chain amino acid transport system substrate-binding protein